MLEEKLDSLKEILKSLESVVIAYSGGVDSTFLSKVAFDVLGDNALAVTARSETYPRSEFEEAMKLAGITHIHMRRPTCATGRPVLATSFTPRARHTNNKNRMCTA